MKIRLAKVTDMKSVYYLLKKLDEKHIRNSKDIKSKIPEERYKSLFDNVYKVDSNFLLIVAEINNKIVGFALGKLTKISNNLILKDQIIGDILYVIIEDKHKRKGIGRKLMEGIEFRLKEKGANKLQLRVYSFNDETVPEKINYKPKYTTYEKY